MLERVVSLVVATCLGRLHAKDIQDRVQVHAGLGTAWELEDTVASCACWSGATLDVCRW